MTSWLIRLLSQDGRLLEGSWQVSRPLDLAWLILILVFGLLLALVNFLPWLAMRWQLRVTTFVLRLAMLAVLLAVICGLEWRVRLEVEQQQSWTVRLDDSASMATRDASGGSRFRAAQQELEQIRQLCAGKVQMRVETFSGQPREDAPGQGPTLFRDVVGRAALSRGQVDQLILLTDGRDSERRDLTRLGEDLKARGVRLAIRLYGSDSPPRDSALSAEPERNLLRLGEELIIRGAVTGSRSQQDVVTLKEDGQQIKTIPLSSPRDGRFEVRHRPKKKGQHVYTLTLAGNDAVPENNTVQFTAQVLEEKINVLLLEGYPRFEFKFLKLILEVDPLVNLVSVAHIPGGGVHVQGQPLHRNPEMGLIATPAELFKYDVVILQDVPRSYFRAGGDTTESRLQNLVQFVTKRGGGLIVLGGQDVYRAGGYADSALTEILPFDLSTRISKEDQLEGLFHVAIPRPAYDHPILQLLPNAADNRERLNSLRQLDGSNNVGMFKPLATPLMMRLVKVKDKGDKVVEKETPILGLLSVGEGKVLAAAVDTLWRWQLQPDFDDPPLTMLMANSVRFLAPPPGRKPGLPNVSLRDSTPQVGQEVELSTDLRDANFDPIQGAELEVTVTRPQGKPLRLLPRDLPEEPGHYVYRVPVEQAGLFKVTARFGKFQAERELLAGASAGEFADLSIDRAGMQQLASAAGGKLVTASLESWLDRTELQPSHRVVVREIEVWNSPLLLGLFLGLVCLDCYLRKRQGLA
jgi:hypothetical protein